MQPEAEGCGPSVLLNTYAAWAKEAPALRACALRFAFFRFALCLLPSYRPDIPPNQLMLDCL